MGFNLFLKNFPLRQPWLNLTMRWKVMVPMFTAGTCLAVTGILLSGSTTEDRAGLAAVAAGRLLAAQAATARAQWPAGSAAPQVASCRELVGGDGFALQLVGRRALAGRSAEAAGSAGEAWEVVSGTKGPVLRYAAADRVRDGCLGCHGASGWQRGDVAGVVEVELGLAPFAAASQTAEWRNRAILAAVYSILVLWLASAMHHSVARPIERIARSTEAMAGGDLTPRFSVISSDEVGRIRAGLNTMLDAVTRSLAAIGESSQAVTGASDDLSRLAREMRGVAESSSREAASVSSSSQQVSLEVSTVAEASRQMNATTREIAASAAEASTVAAEAVDMVGRTTSRMTKLGQSREEIGKVVQVIESVAAQTSLLALNATIEAARAGESGKGFAVVAAEVKQLSAQTAQATREIADKIEAIQADSAAVVDAIGGITMVIMRIHDLQNTIAASVEEQSAATAEIDRSAAQAARDTAAIAAQVTNLAFSAGQATAQAESAADASQSLARMAGDLQTLIERFRLS